MSSDYVTFKKVQPAATQKVVQCQAGLVLDSFQVNSRVAIAAVSPKLLTGYGTPIAIVIVNRSKKPFMVDEQDISLRQDGGKPVLVTSDRANTIDNHYTQSHVSAGMVMALLGGALLAVAHTIDSASVNSIADPLTKDVDSANKTARDRQAAFMRARFRGEYLSPGEATAGYIVVENVKAAPLVIAIKVGNEVHQFTLLTEG
ncbi:hypothetical protein [Paraburkholderia phenoliruptrix]|uniref:hypothetical protein n=1 Tax=Paraburkholderia phenoliruptrix TaxID=252970 RepID=UPI0015815CBD|nr:hypothetical protein [Paraburkholderia phenoliruptrix]